MYFEREQRKQLTAWKRSARKPLIVKGIRQVGKTSLVMEWAREKFTDIIYLDFQNSKINSLFDSFTEPELLIEKISDLSGKSINRNETIIVFDNIDDCPAALKYLPNFNQLRERFYIIAISSYFDVLTKTFGDDYKKHLKIKNTTPSILQGVYFEFTVC